MGRSGLSSKRKHSKKKSLKASSEGRRKKRISKNKSKKLRRHDSSSSSSLSSYSDDASTSSSLVSSSSSEGEYRSRRSRSHTRNEVKGSRKRSRRRSLSEDSIKDSPPVKKRKGSKKKSDSQSRKKDKKIKKKKKSRRYTYISSESISDSASCSTCGDGNSSSDERASFGRRRSRSIEKKKHHKDSIKGKKGNRKNRTRSRSSSPSKLNNSCDDDIIEVENNPRRLKSIITVAKPPENEEVHDMKRDELKEEIVYDYDDYPSCKSNDSNDGESKKELVDRSNVSKKMLTSVIGEVNSASSPNDSNSIKNASGNIGSEVDNLESILRQKALENLSRFRGGIQTKAVVPVDNKHKSDQSGVKQSVIQTPVIQRSRFTWRRDSSVTTGKEEKAATEGGPESGGSQAPAPKLQTANLSSTSSVENKVKVMENNTSSDIGGIETNDGEKATTGLETKEGSSKEQQTESNNSQFEKKTMSVMRGGEMVQVSYKVYIPNRAPALARRQLKR